MANTDVRSPHNGVTNSASSSLSTGISAAEMTPLVDGRGPRRSKKQLNAYQYQTEKIDVERPPPATDPSNADVTPSWMEMMRKVTPFIRPDGSRHTLLAMLALILVVFVKLLNVLPPLAIKWAVDVISSNVSDGDDSGDVSARVPTLAISAYFGLKILSMIVGSGKDVCQWIVSLDAERRFGVATFAHLHSLSLSYHLEKHVGEVTRILNRGSDSVSTFIDTFLFSLAPTLFETLVVTAVFWKLGTPVIAATTLASVAIYFTFTVLVTKTRIKYRRRLVDASDAVGRKETETLVNYETVSMFGRTRDEMLQYGELRQTYKDRRVDMLSVFTLLEFGQRLIRLTGVCVGLLIAAYLTVYGDPPLSPGSFVVIQIYIDQLYQPLSYLGFTYRRLTQAFTDLEKAVTMLNRVPEVKDLPNASPWKQAGLGGSAPCGEIVFDNVSFHYKATSRRKALGGSLGEEQKSKKDLEEKKTEEDALPVVGGGIERTTFSVPSGKTAALVGRSGSGKTTIVRLVLRMYDPDDGTVFVDGQNVKNLKQESLRQNIGVVAQETVLFNATLRDNIVYGKPHATEEEVWSAVRAAALEEFVEGLPNKLETLVGERGMKLSGGERQRVGLARCVIKDPRLILLDEATSALDSGTEREIQRNISDICRGRTTLMIAHRLSTARYADQIIVLNKGEICERGTHEELLAKNGRYAKMWQDQNDPTD